MHRFKICGILSLGLRKHTRNVGKKRTARNPSGTSGRYQNGRTIEAAEHRQGCGGTADSGGNCNPGNSAGLGAKAAWLKIQEIDSSACIHRLLALEGAIQGVKKAMLPDAVKADLKAFYQEHKL